MSWEIIERSKFRGIGYTVWQDKSGEKTYYRATIDFQGIPKEPRPGAVFFSNALAISDLENMICLLQEAAK